jgi:DNA-binding MarR family transcriptional regulator
MSYNSTTDNPMSNEKTMKPDALHPSGLDNEKRMRFLKFIRHICPAADPTSILLFGQVIRANNLLEQAAERNLGGGLTYAKFRLLMNLHRSEAHGASEGMQPSELSDEQGVSRNTVSSLIASLEKDGLIYRELHGTDHRRFVIRLTPEGRKLLKTKMAGGFEFITNCFEGFNAAERQSFLAFLTRLNQKLAEHDK